MNNYVFLQCPDCLCGRLLPISSEEYQQIDGRQNDRKEHHWRANLQEVDECDWISSFFFDRGQSYEDEKEDSSSCVVQYYITV